MYLFLNKCVIIVFNQFTMKLKELTGRHVHEPSFQVRQNSISLNRELSAPLWANIWSWCWQDNTHVLHNSVPARKKTIMRNKLIPSPSAVRPGAAPVTPPGHILKRKRLQLHHHSRTPSWEISVHSQAGYWPVFQGLTLQFVIRLWFLLKLISRLKVGNYSRLGLHAFRRQLQETSKTLRKMSDVFTHEP